MKLKDVGGSGCGCASKVDPVFLRKVLKGLPTFESENLIVGYDTADDAAVYRINDELAMIQTVDVFPPVVDDAYEYGQVAAANAMSDVWAMGGEAATALNIFMFPQELDSDEVHGILEGGYDKAKEAGVIICGGHTIKDPIPKYGLCVSGFVHPDKVLKNNGVKPGDVLILTKPLGVGILNIARKGGVLEEKLQKEAVKNMSLLNKHAAYVGRKFDTIHACTDITGFSLLGHSSEMQDGSGCSLHFDTKKIPVIEGALRYAEMGFVPNLAYMNRGYLDGKIKFANGISEAMQDIMYDPQTSGGLLFAVSEKDSESLLELLGEKYEAASIVGYAEAESEYAVYVD
ncbi:MAG: selenide, water dikinase SelD [Eubacteriales bacterium]|nr:selenide, water dikinase SelD [Eubacteriales bacterium]